MPTGCYSTPYDEPCICQKCEQEFDEDELNEDGVCEECYLEEEVECEECGASVPRSDLKYSENLDKVVCEECFNKNKEEETKCL